MRHEHERLCSAHQKSRWNKGTFAGLLLATATVTPALAEPSPTSNSCTNSQQCAQQDGYGNVCVSDLCQPYVDRSDLFDIFGLAPKKQPPPEPFKLYPALLPAVGYNPALGFLIGVVGTFGMYLGNPADTTMSKLSALVLLTTNKQLVIQLGTTIMTGQNDWELEGDWRFLIYNQNTYGLGTGTPPVSNGFTIGGWGETAPITGAQPMKFNLIRLHETVFKKVSGSFYLGGGYWLTRYYAVVDQSLNLSASPPVVTSSYAYNTVYGFNNNEYTVSGVTANFLYDSRDSSINAYRGFYSQLGIGGFPTWLGSTKASSWAGADVRAYMGLSDEVPRNVIAFWVLAAGPLGGQTPYLALWSIGWDAASTSGRGYVQGRFRGTAEVYAEAEWRFRITNDGFFGGALFASGETFSRPAVSLPTYGYSDAGEKLFQNVKLAGGFGLRFLMSKEARTNIRLDFAWGVNSFGVYLGCGEAF
jgi:hypothetical protein